MGENMTTLIPSNLRHVNAPLMREPLSESRAEAQVRMGLYVLNRGEKIPVPIDGWTTPTQFLSRTFWKQSEGQTMRVGTTLEKPITTATYARRRLALWVAQNGGDPSLVHKAVSGKDRHVTIVGNVFARHWHRGWADPFNSERFDEPLDPWGQTLPQQKALRAHIAGLYIRRPSDRKFSRYERIRAFLATQPKKLSGPGFIEHLGWLAEAKVTDAFVSETVDELVSATGTEFADFDFHEVGTSTQAESNDDTALIATSGISRATGSPTDSDPDYDNAGTITADATETWEEHGLFNNSTGAALMDRNLTGGQSVNSLDQVEYTLSVTFNPEA